MSNPQATVGDANLCAVKLKQTSRDSMYPDQQAVKAVCKLVGVNESDQAGGQAQGDLGRKPHGETPDCETGQAGCSCLVSAMLHLGSGMVGPVDGPRPSEV